MVLCSTIGAISGIMERYLLTSLQMWHHRTDLLSDLEPTEPNTGWEGMTVWLQQCMLTCDRGWSMWGKTVHKGNSTMAAFPVTWEDVSSCCRGTFMVPVMGNRTLSKGQTIWMGHLWEKTKRVALLCSFWGTCLQFNTACDCAGQGMLPKELASFSPSDLAGMVAKRWDVGELFLTVDSIQRKRTKLN